MKNIRENILFCFIFVAKVYFRLLSSFRFVYLSTQVVLPVITHFNRLVLFDGNVLFRCLFSFLMTYKNKLRKRSLSHIRRSSTRRNKRLKQNSEQQLQMNLMNFIEITPIIGTDLPYPRSGHRAIATDSDFWIWGGFHPSGTNNQQPKIFDELWRFNYALQRWTLETTTGDRPNGTLASHSMLLYHRNLVLVFGGTGFPFGHTVSDDLHILDLKRRQWRRCQFPQNRPAPVYGASMITNDEHLYILCGTNSAMYNSDVYDIHLPTLTCTQIGFTFDEIEETFENGRYRQEAYLHDNKIYVFGGGGTSGISFSLETLPVFDLIDRRWSFIHTNPDPVHNYPLSRKFHSIFPFHDNQVIIFGGAHANPTSHQHSVVNDNTWIFDFTKLEWSRLTLSMLKPSYFHAAAINEHGEIWSHGGVVRAPTLLQNETRITTLYKMHVRVPKLSEFCWNFILNSVSDRTDFLTDRSLFLKLNIPTRFSERVY